MTTVSLSASAGVLAAAASVAARLARTSQDLVDCCNFMVDSPLLWPAPAGRVWLLGVDGSDHVERQWRHFLCGAAGDQIALGHQRLGAALGLVHLGGGIAVVQRVDFAFVHHT